MLNVFLAAEQINSLATRLVYYLLNTDGEYQEGKNKTTSKKHKNDPKMTRTSGRILLEGKC